MDKAKVRFDSLKIGSRYSKAYAEFSKLEAVDDDPARVKTISDLVYIAQFEIDLVEAGESDVDVRLHRKFVKKWNDGGMI